MLDKRGNKNTLDDKLTALEVLFARLPNRGIVFFYTLALPKEDHGLNAQLIERFTRSFEECSVEQQKIAQDAVTYMKEVRIRALHNEHTKKLLASKIDSIHNQLALNMIISENALASKSADSKYFADKFTA